MTNGQGLAWLGFWLMLGLWNLNVDINVGAGRDVIEELIRSEVKNKVNKNN